VFQGFNNLWEKIFVAFDHLSSDENFFEAAEKVGKNQLKS
jgi:hypothetical protein